MAAFTFFSCFMWSPEAEQHKAVWQQLITGMKLAAGAVYPDSKFAWSECKINSAPHVSQVIGGLYSKARRELRGDVAVIEVDVVCNRACDPFEDDFDIGLCDAKDKWAMMPFNPGVMFLKDTPGCQRFLDETARYATHIPGNFPAWYAYQLAVGYAYMALKDEVRVKVFPNSEYNWAPDVYAPTDAYFIHLKGERKKMQRDYVLPIIEGQRGKIILP